MMTQGSLRKEALVGIAGAGAMGIGIAQVAALAGHPVRLFDTREGLASAAIGQIRNSFDRLAQKGLIRHDEADAAASRVSVALTLADFSRARLVIEAIVERLDEKQALFAKLEPLIAKDAILATNSSSLSVTAISSRLRRPERVVGMHFFNPACLAPLVEVISGLATSPAVAKAVFSIAQHWGKTPVHARSAPGFIVNRLARPFFDEALRLLSEQVGSVATLDALMRDAGEFCMGPFELMDFIGNDVNLAVTKSVFSAFFGDRRFEPSLIQQELVAAGHLGIKSGRGFYDYAHDVPFPLPHTEPPAECPGNLVVWTSSRFGRALAARLVTAGVAFEARDETHWDLRLLEADDAVVYMTDGRTATRRAADLGNQATVLIDLSHDIFTTKRIGISVSETCSPRALASGVGALQAAGIAVSRLVDVPGLVVMRTVAVLANGAADAVNQGVCDAAAADLALRVGANYPRGPLDWANGLGLKGVLGVLEHLQDIYGEDRYRPSPLLRRLVAAGHSFDC